jgi:carbonic anhydrase
MEPWQRMLLANRAWVEGKTALRADYFTEMAKAQRPDFLWIGCSDSRVPAEEITGVTPGELFVTRNVANLVVSTDLNLLSVLQYAVDHLKVRHVIVCGHHGCGGVKAAMSHGRYGLMNKWLRAIKDVYHHNKMMIDLHPTEEQRVDKLVEINIVEQVHNLTKTSIIQGAWRREQRPTLHGWCYGLRDGIIHPLIQVDPNSKIDDIYRFDFGDDE